MKNILKLLKPHLPAVLAVIVLLIVQAFSELSLPGYMSDIVDIGLTRGGVAEADAAYMTLVAAGQADESVQMAYLWSTGGKMAGVALLAAAASIAVSFISGRVGAQVGRDLRRQVFAKVLSFSHSELDQFSTASLITRCTNDISQVQMVITMILRMVLFAPVMGLGGIVMVISTRSGLGWIAVAGVVGLACVMGCLMSFALPKFKMMQSLVDRVNLISREILTGLSVIRAFSRQKHEERRFDGANTILRNTQLFTGRTMATMIPLMSMVMYSLNIAIIWFGAEAIQANSLEIGDMMAFMNYVMQIVFSFMMISMISIMLPRAMVAAGRIWEVLETESSIAAPDEPVGASSARPQFADAPGTIVFENVSYRYPGAEDDALRHISFTAEPGKTTAIIGSTGSGKTTLLNLIPRFYDVTEGSVTVDGVDVRELPLHTLRSKLGYVPQKAVLFSGTIASNIGYAGNTDEADLRTAARVAQAADFIAEKPEGMDTSIAQGGSNVSGGQKQRLSIARAIAARPHVYLFDDSFSALDYKTDAELRKALSVHAKDATVIIVGQRIATVMHADNIIVLKDGEIDGMGTHARLLETCETYREIASSQLSAAELGMEVTDHA